MLAFWGFDNTSTVTSSLQFDAGGGFGGLTTGFPVAPGSGVQGNCAVLAGRSQLTRILAAATTWSAGFHVRFDSSSGLCAQNKFLAFHDITGAIVSLELQTDGRIAVVVAGDLFSGTSGQIAITPLPVVTIGAWLGFIELEVTGLGGAIAFNVWLDDVLLLSGAGFNPGTGTRKPDRVSFMTNNGTAGGVHAQPGFTGKFDNAYGAAGELRLGPIQIQAFLASADQKVSLNRVSGSSNASMYFKSFPDFDGLYTFGNEPQFDLYSLAKTSTKGDGPCFGRILAVAVSICSRAFSGAPLAQILCQPNPFDPSVVQVGGNFVQLTTPNLVGSLYKTFQAVSEVNLLKGAGVWIDGDLAQGYWGVGIATTAAGALRVSQLFFEKVVSLRAVPFSCGSLGGYAY
jgi:hypothetical protein